MKGYEFKKDTYVVLTDEDFESARVESSSVIKIDKFVETRSIDPIYFDASYYVGPDGDAGTDVYAVLREAIASTGMAALARVVIARRERAICLVPMQKGLVAPPSTRGAISMMRPMFSGKSRRQSPTLR